MTIKRIAIIFGTLFIVLGWLGFVSALTPGGNLLGVFAMNSMHNMVHIATGVVAIVAALAGEKASKVFFQTFGIIYAVVAMLDIFPGDQPLLEIVSNSMADAGLHAVVAAAF